MFSIPLIHPGRIYEQRKNLMGLYSGCLIYRGGGGGGEGHDDEHNISLDGNIHWLPDPFWGLSCNVSIVFDCLPIVL